MLRKILTVFLTVIIISFPLPSMAEESEIKYNITFEDGYLGIAPSGFSVYENGNIVEVVELEKGYNGESQRCICLGIINNISSGNSCYAQKNFSAFETDNYVIDFWYYPGDTVTKKPIYIRDRETRANPEIVTFNEDGFIVLPNDSYLILGEYEGDKWYHVQMVFRTKTLTYDFYLDNNLLAENCTTPVDGVPAAIYFYKMYTAKKTENTYIDSLRLYTGEELLDDSTFPVPERTKGYADFYSLADGEVYMHDTFEEQFPYTTHANYRNTRNGNHGSLEPTEEGNVIMIASKETAAEKWMYTEKDMKFFKGKVVIDLCVKALDTHSKFEIYIRDVTGYQFVPFTFDHGLLFNSSKKIMNYEADKWYRFVMMFDMDKKTANYFINGERIGTENQSFDFTNIRTLRLYCTYETDAKYYIDNVSVYGGTEILNEFPPKTESYDFRPVTKELAGDKLDGSVSLFLGGNKAFLNGEIKPLDESNEKITPVIREGRTLLPVRFVAENMGANVSWNEKSKKIVVQNYSKKLEMTVGSKEAVKNREPYTLYAAPQIIEDRAFLPIRDVADFLGKQVYWHDMGLVVIGDNAEKLDYSTDETLIHHLIGNLLYDRPSPEKIYEDVVKNNPGKAHPRVMLSNEQIELLKNAYYTDADPRGKRYMQDVLDYADSYIGYPLPEWQRDSTQLASTLRNRIGSMSLSYLITGEEKYKDEIWYLFSQMMTYENWLSVGGIYFGEALTAVAIAYDWLYYHWSEEQRNIMLDAMKNIGMRDLVLTCKQEGMGLGTWLRRNTNFNAVGSTGALFFCLSVIDEEELREDAAWCASVVLRGIENCICEVMPDGAWLEGLVYWSYSMRFATPLMETLRRCCGTDYGIFDTPGFKTTGDFLIYTQGPTGIFNFHDAVFARRTGVEMFALSRLMGNNDYGMINTIYKDMDGLSGAWLEILYHTPIDTENYKITLPYDKYFRKIEVASFRNSWEQDANFIAFHGGYIGGAHSEFDAGSFVIDALGERWVHDLGPDEYNLTDYNTIRQDFRHYRRRSEGHNTIVINPSEDAGQLISKTVLIEPKVFNSSDKASAVMDMTDVYSHQYVKSVKRGISLEEGRTRFIIRDEIETFYPSEIYWFMHTDAEITLSSDGKEAVLSKNGKQLRVRVLEDNISLSVMDAVPLETSPSSPKQSKNEGFRKLYINSKEAQNVTYTVVIDPITEENKTFVAPQVQPLDMWG